MVTFSERLVPAVLAAGVLLSGGATPAAAAADREEYEQTVERICVELREGEVCQEAHWEGAVVTTPSGSVTRESGTYSETTDFYDERDPATVDSTYENLIVVSAGETRVVRSENTGTTDGAQGSCTTASSTVTAGGAVRRSTTDSEGSGC